MKITFTLDTYEDKDLFESLVTMGLVFGDAKTPAEEPTTAPKPKAKAKKKAAPKKPKPTAAAKVIAGEPEAVAAVVAATAAPTLDEVRNAFRTFCQEQNTTIGLAKLQDQGVTRLSDLPEDQYGEFLASISG